MVWASLDYLARVVSARLGVGRLAAMQFQTRRQLFTSHAGNAHYNGKPGDAA